MQCLLIFEFSALALLPRLLEGHPTCKNLLQLSPNVISWGYLTDFGVTNAELFVYCYIQQCYCYFASEVNLKSCLVL